MTVELPRVMIRRSRWAATAVALLSFHVASCSEIFKVSPTEPASREATLSEQQADPSSDEGANRDRGSERKAKSAVIFIGDGMGVSTVTAARIYAGQKRGVDGESYTLSWEDFPQVALVKTYNDDAQVPDSAGTATAILSGYRAKIGKVNIPPNLESEESACDYAALPPTLLQLAKAKEMKVGVVSTARITHATPAAVYGYALRRGWEGTPQVPDEFREAGCTSLGEQLAAAPLDLVMGGGAALEEIISFDRYNQIDDLGAITLPALRLYTDSHMSYEAQRVAGDLDEPSLAEMTEAAINALSGESGYVLMVEAGRIDHAHHGNAARVALEDTVALDEAVAVAKRLTGDDTLILVTADHSHVLTISGYPARGNPIHGLVHTLDDETGEVSDIPVLAEDGRPYTTLSYGNGRASRAEADFDRAGEMDFLYPGGVPTESETHAGEDVPLYATGAGAEAFGGVMDQPEIGQALHQVLGLVD